MPGAKRVRNKKPPEEKSQRIQFRLHPEIAEELTALQILEFWKNRGYDTRYILASALHALEAYDLPPINPSESEPMQLFRKEVLSTMQEYINEAVQTAVQNALAGLDLRSGYVSDDRGMDHSAAVKQSHSLPAADGKPNSKTKQFAMNVASFLQPAMSDENN